MSVISSVWSGRGSIRGGGATGSVRSRSRSRGGRSIGSQGIWGAATLSVASSVDSGEGDEPVRSGDLYLQLPEDNNDTELESLFVALVVGGEVGPATFFADIIRDTCKPRFLSETHKTPTDVWCYDSAGCLWEPIVYNVWRLRLQTHCTHKLRAMLNQLDDIVQDRLRTCRCHRYKCEGGQKCPIAKAWTFARTKANRAMSRMGTLPTLNNVAEIAVNLLRDSAFFSRLDARKDIISFPNGVVELRTGVIRPRVMEDCLSYVMPYEYDPLADTSRMEQFVHSIFEDAESETAMRVHAGYMTTGETTSKVFYQFTSPPHAGKSNLLKVFSNALARYASMSDAPIAEFLCTSQFETSIAALLSRQPPLRVLISDEAHAESVLNEELVNLVSSGLPDITVPLRCKHLAAKVQAGWRAKLIFSSNHVFRLPSGALGTAARIVGPPLRFQFVEHYDPETALPLTRPRDNAMTGFMTSDAARPGVIRWMIEGARLYYAAGLRTSVLWDAQQRMMQWKGDVFAEWLSETYFPTGSIADKVPYAMIRQEFCATHKTARHPDAMIKSSLAGMSSYITSMEWEEVAPGAFFVAVPGAIGAFPRARAVGYGGLRLRRLGDMLWADSVPIAMEIAAEARRAV